MKKNQIFFGGLLCLQILLFQQEVISSAAASWVTSTLPAVVQTPDDSQAVIDAISQNIGSPAASAAALIATGATSPQPYLNYSWFNSFAAALSNGAMPYSGMNSFVLADLFKKAKSSVEYSYIINHLVPALQEMGNNLTNSAESLVGTLDNVIITTINNNTQMNFDIYQGANVANVGASNINLQPSIVSGGSNSYYPGFKIGSLKPGVNNVALYGAAQGQGDILFVPNDGSGALPTNGTASGSFRIHFLPPSQSSSSAYICVQILPVDFPANQEQQTQSMIQRTQCIDVSQAKTAINLTLQIEDQMTVWAPSIPATATAAAIQGTPPTPISQSMIPMYYPSIRSMILVPQNVPFLYLPEKIASQPILSSWINFINIVASALQVSSASPFLMTPNNIANTLANQPVTFFLKKQGDQFGNISKNIRTAPYVVGKNMNTNHYSLQAANPLQPSVVPVNPGAQEVFCAYAGLVGTQYLFTGDIPSIDDFNLFLQMNTSVSNQQPGQLVSFDKSITLTNIWTDLQQKAVSLWNNIANFLNLTVNFVELSGQEALYQISNSQNITGSPIVQLLPVNGLLMYALSTSTQPASLKQQNGQPASFVVKDIIAHVQALMSGATNKQYMPIVGGSWGYVQNQYGLRIVTSPGESQLYTVGSSISAFIQDLQKNNNQMLYLLLKQPQVSLLVNNGQTLVFNSFDVLQSIFAQHKYVLFSDGRIVPFLQPAQGTARFLNLEQDLTQFSFSPTFSDGSTSMPLSLPAHHVEALNKALKLSQYVTISFQVIPGPNIKGMPSCDANITIKGLGSQGSFDVNVLSYEFKNLINEKDEKTPIAKTATLKNLHVSSGGLFPDLSKVSIPQFTLQRNIIGFSPAVTPKSAKA